MSQSRAKLEKKIDKYAGKGRFDKAIAECQKLLSLFKGDLQARQRLAELLAQSGNDPEAIRTYFKLAKRYIKNGLPDQAVRIFNRILALDSGHIDSLMQLADLALTDGTQEEAITHLLRAAETLARRDNVRTCMQVLERIEKIQPGNHEYRLRIAEVFAELYQANTAAGEFTRVVLMLKQNKRFSEAIQVAKQVAELVVTDVEVLCELGEAISDLDQWELVEQIEKKVKAIGREAAEARRAIAQDTDNVPTDIESSPPAKLAAIDLTDDNRTTEEVAIPEQKPKAGEKSDIYSELFGDDDSSE